MASYPIDSAAISWVDGNGNTNIQVFWSDGYTVYQRVWSGNGWSTGSFKEQGGQVSATVWTNGGNAYIRVYCTFEDTMTEWCQDAGGSWYNGGFTVS